MGEERLESNATKYFPNQQMARTGVAQGRFLSFSVPATFLDVGLMLVRLRLSLLPSHRRVPSQPLYEMMAVTFSLCPLPLSLIYAGVSAHYVVFTVFGCRLLSLCDFVFSIWLRLFSVQSS